MSESKIHGEQVIDEEWCYVSYWKNGTVHVIPCLSERSARFHADSQLFEGGQVSHRRVASRTVTTSPWVEEDLVPEVADSGETWVLSEVGHKEEQQR
jgi:hypothetical protein